MKTTNFNTNSYSLKLFTPEKTNPNKQKFNTCDRKRKSLKEISNKNIKIFNTIANKSYYFPFKYRKYGISSNFNYTLFDENNYNNDLCQCLSINNRYSNLSTNFNSNNLPSINNDNTQRNTSRKTVYNNTITISSFGRLKTESRNKNFDVNLINTDELTKISSLLLSFKSRKKKKKQKKKDYFLNKIKFNSLMYHLNKESKLNDYQIQNRYRPIYKEFFGKKDYIKFKNKSKKFIRTDELKTLYKETTLINGIFEYLNKYYLKIRYTQAKKNQKILEELLKKKKEESQNYYHNSEKEINLPLDKLFQIKKIAYNKRQGKTLSVDNKNGIKENKNIMSSKKELDKPLIVNILKRVNTSYDNEK